MRTTITLDPDVTVLVKEEMKRSGLSFKNAVNKMIRSVEVEKIVSRPKKFKVRAKRLGEKPGYNFDNIGVLLEQIEEPSHK